MDVFDEMQMTLSEEKLRQIEKEGPIQKEEVAIENAIYLVEQANKLQAEGRNVTLGIIEEKNIGGKQVKVFNDGSQKIVVRRSSMDLKFSILCLSVVGIMLFLAYSHCLY